MNQREEQLKQVELERIEKLTNALDKLKAKKSKFMFFVANTLQPSAAIHEIYFHATLVKKMGYESIMLTDVEDYVIPTYLDSELVELEHISMAKAQLTVGPEDVLIIPEIFSNVMEQTKNLPCIRVAFIQSIDFALNALIPAMDWSSFGIKKVLTTSEQLKSLIIEYFGENKFEISTYTIGIPDYFAPSKEPKRPVISIVGRNANEITKIVKLFYLRYPHYSWIGFDTMQTESKPPQLMRRKDFAEKLSKNFAAVWIDRISNFGTFPLECMKCGTIPVAIIPDITPEYLIDREKNDYVQNCGIWTNDFYALPKLLGDLITKFLDDNISDEVYTSMREIASKYSIEKSESDLSTYYKSLLDERIRVIESELERLKSKSEAVNTSI